jgi:hypothetical protein
VNVARFARLPSETYDSSIPVKEEEMNPSLSSLFDLPLHVEFGSGTKKTGSRGRKRGVGTQTGSRGARPRGARRERGADGEAAAGSGERR